MATKLYLHRTEISSPGTLPSGEQSSLAPDANLFDNEDGTENRLMDKTISAVSQATLTNTTTGDTSAHNYYIARWVSPLLAQTSVAANTWTLEFAASEANANANFPRNGAGALRVCAYVWKPSNGTKYGNILDGNTNADGEEAGTTQTVMNCTFSGASVGSLTSGDAVIVIELWAIVTMGNATQRVVNVFYDGTTENSTTNMAARLETPENLAFAYTTTLPTETVSSSESATRILGANRSLSTETTSSSESVARSFGATRAMGTETVSSSESLTRQLAATRAMSTETTTVGETLTRIYGAIRAIAAEVVAIAEQLDFLKESGGNNYTATLDTETVTVGESLTRQLGATRALSTETVTVGETLTRTLEAMRALATETVNSSESLQRLLAATRALATETVTVAENLTTSLNGGAQQFVRTITETVDVLESLTRQLAANRTLSDTVNSSESVQRVLGAVRAFEETVTSSESVQRIYGAVRALATETVAISDSVAGIIIVGTEYVRSLIENVSISDTLTFLARYVFRPKSRDPIESRTVRYKHTDKQWYKHPFHRLRNRVRNRFRVTDTEGS